MNAGRVPFEAPKEHNGVCFGGFRPTKHVEEPWALARGGSTSVLTDARISLSRTHRSFSMKRKNRELSDVFGISDLEVNNDGRV
jgi:hypothetical protein